MARLPRAEPSHIIDKSFRSDSLSFLSLFPCEVSHKGIVIGQTLIGYKPRAVTTLHNQTSPLPYSRAINSSLGASGKHGGQQFRDPFLYISLRKVLKTRY